MAIMEIAIEIGTSYTSIYLSGNGIVLREPSIVAFNGDPKDRCVRAVGNAAFDMIGKTPERTVLISPVSAGYIVNPDACAVMLKEFIKKILPEGYIFFPKIKAILGVPMGLKIQERKVYEDICYYSGVYEITMVENIILSAVGIELPIHKSCGGVIVNIGGGVTEVAALSFCGVIKGFSVSVGGDEMDEALVHSIMGKYNLTIGIPSVKKLRCDIGSLYENDISQTQVMGSNVKTKDAEKAVILAADLYKVLKPYYLQIADVIEGVINLCPPEIAADIYRMGIHVVGGAGQITGIDKLLNNRLKLNVYVSEDASYAAINGGGRLLNDKVLLKEILSQK